MVEITQVKLAGGERHEHIVEVAWRNPDDGATGRTSREGMVEWLRKPGSYAFVSAAGRQVAVAVVNAPEPFIRTHTDGEWTDNLLALSRYV